MIAIADIDSIDIVYRIGTLDIGFFRHIDIVSVTSEMSVISRYFIILFPTFKRYFKDKQLLAVRGGATVLKVGDNFARSTRKKIF